MMSLIVAVDEVGDLDPRSGMKVRVVEAPPSASGEEEEEEEAQVDEGGGGAAAPRSRILSPRTLHCLLEEDITCIVGRFTGETALRVLAFAANTDTAAVVAAEQSGEASARDQLAELKGQVKTIKRDGMAGGKVTLLEVGWGTEAAMAMAMVMTITPLIIEQVKLTRLGGGGSEDPGDAVPLEQQWAQRKRPQRDFELASSGDYPLALGRRQAAALLSDPALAAMVQAPEAAALRSAILRIDEATADPRQVLEDLCAAREDVQHFADAVLRVLWATAPAALRQASSSCVAQEVDDGKR